MHPWEIIIPEFRKQVENIVRRRIKGEKFTERYTALKMQGKEGVKYLKAYSTTVRWGGRYAGVVVGVDVTKEKNLEKSLKREKRKIETILENITDSVFILDREGIVKYVSPSIEKVFGVRARAILGKNLEDVVPSGVRDIARRIREEVFANPGKLYSFEIKVRDAEGNYKWCEVNAYLPEEWEELELEGAILFVKDITDKRLTEEKMFEIFNYDSLTGLPNRALFMEKLEYVLEFARKRGEMVAVAVVDVSRFKEIVSVYGVEVANEFLKEFTKRLKSKLFTSDVVSRFFSDEFGIILPGIKKKEGLIKAVEKLLSVVQDPFVCIDKTINMGIFVGVAVYPFDGSEPSELLKKANMALSKSREIGENKIAFYSEKVESELMEEALIKHSLNTAIDRGELFVYYQPIFDLVERRPVGVEALVRWKHPELGFIPPVKFIKIAEETGVIVKLGEMVLNVAASDMEKLYKAGLKDLYLSVNVSPKQLLEKDVVERFLMVLENYKNLSGNIVLEITEGFAMKEPKRVVDILKKLKEYNFKIAIDDFGTGYSSLSYLIELNPDVLKIDKKFILSMDENPNAFKVVETVIKLSNSLGMCCIAEGVEKKEQLTKLVEIGCYKGQGYLFSPPVSFEKIREYLLKYSDLR